MDENITLPPELTDLIIQHCATDTDISTSKSNPSSPHSVTSSTLYDVNTTLLACSLVCKNWLPTSRNLTFSHITLRCISEDLKVFLGLYESPNCTFRGRIQGMKLMLPRECYNGGIVDLFSEGVFTAEALRDLLKICTSTLQSLIIDGGKPRIGLEGLREFVQDQLKCVLLSTSTSTSSSLLHLTNLTISSLEFKSSTNLTDIIRSFPELKSLVLHDLLFEDNCYCPYLPPQKLEKLELEGDGIGEMIFQWLMSFPTLTTSPIKVLKLSNVERRMGLLRLVQYLMVHKELGIELVEIEFDENMEELGFESMLRRSLELTGIWTGNGNSDDKPPRIVIITSEGKRINFSSSLDSRTQTKKIFENQKIDYDSII